MSLLVVGQNPARPLAAPFDAPSGDRLARLLHLPSRAELLAHPDITLTNLVPTVGTPTRRQYDDGAERLRDDYPGRRVVLACGGDVSAALGGPRFPLAFAETDAGWLVCCLPHPSGRNRWWNDERQTQAASLLARAALLLACRARDTQTPCTTP